MSQRPGRVQGGQGNVGNSASEACIGTRHEKVGTARAYAPTCSYTTPASPGTTPPNAPTFRTTTTTRHSTHRPSAAARFFTSWLETSP